MAREGGSAICDQVTPITAPGKDPARTLSFLTKLQAAQHDMQKALIRPKRHFESS